MESLTTNFEGKVRKSFADYDRFSNDELLELFKEYYPNLKKSTFYWRVYDLKKRGAITPIEKGVYILSDYKRAYEPILSDLQLKVSYQIGNAFADISYCSWNSSWLNEFSRHQAYNNILLVNVERDLVKPVFYMLKDNRIENLYLTPDRNVIENYISEIQEAVVISSLITKSPITKASGIPIPTLEKMLVDAFCDDRLLGSYGGYELITIFRNAFDEFIIDISKMISYSRRRRREHQLKEFLIVNKILKEKILYD